MNVNQQRVLIDWATLQLRVARAKAPDARADVTEATISKSAAYLALRGWFTRLSPRAKKAAALVLRQQCNGVQQVIAKARAAGIAPDYADLELTIRDPETGEIAEPAELLPAPLCPQSGARHGGQVIHRHGISITKCRRCQATWPGAGIAVIPDHEPTT